MPTTYLPSASGVLIDCWNCGKECDENQTSIDPVSGNLHSHVCRECRNYLLSTIEAPPLPKRYAKMVEGWPDPANEWTTFDSPLRYS